jgi:hypothetical protein
MLDNILHWCTLVQAVLYADRQYAVLLVLLLNEEMEGLWIVCIRKRLAVYTVE